MGLFNRRPKPLVLPPGEITWTHTFWDGRHNAMHQLRPGLATFELRRQPDNEADPKAVQLHTPAGPVAYLPAEDAARISRILDKLTQPLYAQGQVVNERGEPTAYVSLPNTRAINTWLKQQKAIK